MAPKKHTHEEIINQIRNIPAERLPELHDLLQGFLQGQKRDYARKQLSTEIDLVIQDRVYKQQMENISARGVFVRIKGKFELGTQARFILDLPGTETPLKLTGHITRVADDGIAIQFDNTTTYFQEFLNSTIWPGGGIKLLFSVHKNNLSTGQLPVIQETTGDIWRHLVPTDMLNQT